MSCKMSQEFEGQGAIENSISTRCAKCDVDMLCGALGGETNCWCKGFPRLPLETCTDLNQCLCPSCLGSSLNSHVRQGVEVRGVEAMVSLASQNCVDPEGKSGNGEAELIEFVDYQIEDGNYVFSPWYHLKRGYCCGSGCRNCPFE